MVPFYFTIFTRTKYLLIVFETLCKSLRMLIRHLKHLEGRNINWKSLREGLPKIGSSVNVPTTQTNWPRKLAKFRPFWPLLFLCLASPLELQREKKIFIFLLETLAWTLRKSKKEGTLDSLRKLSSMLACDSSLELLL